MGSYCVGGSHDAKKCLNMRESVSGGKTLVLDCRAFKRRNNFARSVPNWSSSARIARISSFMST